MLKDMLYDMYFLEPENEMDQHSCGKLYQFERKLFQNIRMGITPVNETPMPAIHNEWFLSVIPDREAYSRQQYATYCGIACKSAIEGGAQIRDAFMLWKYYQNELGNINGEAETDLLAERMLNDFSRLVREAQDAGAMPDQIASAVIYIRQHLHNPLSVQEIARAISKSSSQLDRDFRNCLGCTPSGYVMQCRIERAEKYLIYTGLNIIDISESLGFKNPSHFSAVFRRKTGLSPSEYRKCKCRSLASGMGDLNQRI